MSKSYRALAYACILATGASGLVLQIVWQRYLGVLVGSEARSIVLVVAVFLFGLATGYRFWGGQSARPRFRAELLRRYGLVEMGIGLYAAVFPWLFAVMQRVSHALPGALALDIVYAAALLFVPTFLMGATVPLLTTALPETPDEISACHARIYGINTLGACLGTGLAAFFLVPRLGLRSALLAASAVDVAAGLFFALGRVSGEARRAPARKTDPPALANPFGPRALLAVAFVSGAVSISLEVIFVRVFALGVGSAYYVFPIVLGVFVLGLALGSLTLGARKVGAGRLVRELCTAVVALGVTYLLVPYWPNWLMRVRLRLGDAPAAYPLYLAFLAAFLALALGPALASLGRLLPLCYALLDKKASDYGRVCGRLYFINTLGTVTGSLVLGYLALYVLDLDGVCKVALAGLAACAAYLAFKGRNRARGWYRSPALILSVALTVTALALPRWSRDSYYVGLFRPRSIARLTYHGLFERKHLVVPGQVAFYKDGPDVTVAVPRYFGYDKYSQAQSLPTRSIVVNGKSDGNTRGDYSTMALVATLPYLSVDKPSGLRAGVLGLGTGITAGLLGKFSDVESVDVVEIAGTVIEAGREFEYDNLGVRANSKIRFNQADAFHYFARAAVPLDILVAEPSNPWVVGVENLFTPEFYELVKRNLAPGGVYVQWIHLYEMDLPTLAGVFRNVMGSFAHSSVFTVGLGDIAILASETPLRGHELARRYHEPYVMMANARAGLTTDVDSLYLLHLFDERYLRAYLAANPGPVHSLEHPWLSYRAARARFFDRSVSLFDILDERAGAALLGVEGKGEALARFTAAHPHGLPQCLGERTTTAAFCARFDAIAKDYAILREPLYNAGWSRLWAYHRLRGLGLAEPDRKVLGSVREILLEAHGADADLRRETGLALLAEYIREGWNDEEHETEGLLVKNRIVPPELLRKGT